MRDNPPFCFLYPSAPRRHLVDVVRDVEEKGNRDRWAEEAVVRARGSWPPRGRRGGGVAQKTTKGRVGGVWSQSFPFEETQTLFLRVKVFRRLAGTCTSTSTVVRGESRCVPGTAPPNTPHSHAEQTRVQLLTHSTALPRNNRQTTRSLLLQGETVVVVSEPNM